MSDKITKKIINTAIAEPIVVEPEEEVSPENTWDKLNKESEERLENDQERTVIVKPSNVSPMGTRKGDQGPKNLELENVDVPINLIPQVVMSHAVGLKLKIRNR